MNQPSFNAHIGALLIFSAFIVTVYVGENTFDKVSRAAAKRANVQAAALELSADAQCIPAGPGKCTGSNKPGKDQCPCKEAKSGSPGLCISGKCKGFGNAGQSADQAAGQMAGQLVQSMMQMLQQLMQGGGGGGGGGGAQLPIEVAQTPTVLDNASTTPLTNIGELDPIDLSFGGGGGTPTTTTTQTTNAPGGDNTATTTPNGGTNETDEDSITTRYETLGTIGENGEVTTDTFNEARGDDDTSEFDSELNGAGLGDDNFVFGQENLDTNALTQDELELLALEALARQQNPNSQTQGGSLDLPYGQLTPDEIRRLQTLGYSTVSGELNPFSGAGNAAPVEEDQPGFFARVASFFARIFGVGAPQQ